MPTTPSLPTTHGISANALVRANYRNIAKGIDCDNSFLIAFLRNLLYKESHELKNNSMQIPDLHSSN